MACPVCSPQNRFAPPRWIEGVRTHTSTYLLRMSTGVFFLASNGEWRSRRLKSCLDCTREVEGQTGWLGCVISFTDQLMTPYFSGGSTLNGTTGGDRWARVPGGQIGYLSEPLHRLDAECSGSTSLKMQTHGKHEKISSPIKHTTKSTSAQRPRPPRDGARQTTTHALAHARPLL